MANDALSQQEVDGLLQGFSDDEPVDETAIREAGDYPSSVNLADRELRVGKRIQAFEIINERFIQLLRIGIGNLLRGGPVISSASSRALKYSEFLHDLPLPTNLNVVTLQPLHGTTLFACEPALIFAVIDNMFGGTGKIHAPFDGRDFTKTEQRIIRRLVAVILDTYQKAWEPIYPLQFKHVRSEMHTSFVEIAEPTDIVIVTSFDLKLGDAGGVIRICIPYASLEPIRGQLEGRSQKGIQEPDSNWLQSLTAEIQSADVNLLANFASIPISLGQVLQMNPGDIIQFDMPKTINAEVDGVTIFECRYGTSNGKYALKIERIVAAH